MMDNNKNIIVEIYKAAKKHDADLLKRYNDKNLSDGDYFWCAINEDIMSNVQSLILHHTINNIESPLVDNNCRSILEAIALARMYKSGKITALQLKIFRYSYALVETDNYKKIQKTIDLKTPEEIQHDKELALNLFAEQFSITRSELDKLIKGEKNKKKRLFLQDPLSFLASSPSELSTIKYIELIKENIGIQHIEDLYSIFSIFEHPRYDEDDKYESIFLKSRESFIAIILGLVRGYFNTHKFFLVDGSDISDDSADIFESEHKKTNIIGLQMHDLIFKDLVHQLATYGDSYDGMCLFVLRKLQCYAKSMFITRHRGLHEQTLSAFRSFAEFISVVNCINMLDLKAFYATRNAYTYSSRIQVVNLINKITNSNLVIDDQKLLKAFNDYYKEAYAIKDFEQFKENIKKNNRYVIKKFDNSYTNLVSNYFDPEFSKSTEFKNQYTTIYKFALDLSHASGYSFNSSINIAEANADSAYLLVWNSIKLYVERYYESKKDHGYYADISKSLLIIQEFINALSSELDKKYP